MSKSRATGTRWESTIRDFLIDSGWLYCERRTLSGVNDKGDIAGIPAVMVEAKAEKQIALASYMNEVEVEKRNANAEVGVAWVKRRGKSAAGDGYVVMSGHQFVQLLKAAGY